MFVVQSCDGRSPLFLEWCDFDIVLMKMSVRDNQPDSDLVESHRFLGSQIGTRVVREIMGGPLLREVQKMVRFVRTVVRD